MMYGTEKYILQHNQAQMGNPLLLSWGSYPNKNDNG